MIIQAVKWANVYNTRSDVIVIPSVKYFEEDTLSKKRVRKMEKLFGIKFKMPEA